MVELSRHKSSSVLLPVITFGVVHYIGIPYTHAVPFFHEVGVFHQHIRIVHYGNINGVGILLRASPNLLISEAVDGNKIGMRGYPSL